MNLRLPLIVVILVPLLSACTQASALPNIDSSQTYHGYPCFNECAAFKQGYDSALTGRYASESACASLPTNQRNGCRSAVTDLRVDTLHNGGLYLQSSP